MRVASSVSNLTISDWRWTCVARVPQTLHGRAANVRTVHVGAVEGLSSNLVISFVLYPCFGWIGLWWYVPQQKEKGSAALVLPSTS